MIADSYVRAHAQTPAEQAALAGGIRPNLKTLPSLGAEEPRIRLYPLGGTFSDITGDHCNVVVWTVAMYERLFSDLLVRMLVSRGNQWVEAGEVVSKKCRRADLRKKLFKETSGISLEKAVDEFGVPGLYQGWQEVATRRNNFLHITPGAISADLAERAFEIAKNGFGLFAYLQNKCCVAGALARIV
jgi:hypothetical protein